jgi:hypothetical protein
MISIECEGDYGQTVDQLPNPLPTIDDGRTRKRSRASDLSRDLGLRADRDNRFDRCKVSTHLLTWMRSLLFVFLEQSSGSANVVVVLNCLAVAEI